MTLLPNISSHLKMPIVCIVGENVPITVQVKNLTKERYPSEDDNYLVIEVWDEMIKYYPGRKGHTTLNIQFSKPFKLNPQEVKEFKFYFELPEQAQYKIRANLNLVKVVKTNGNPKWENHISGRLSSKLGKTATLQFEEGQVILEVLDVKGVSKKKSCTTNHNLIVIVGSISAILAAIASIVSLILQLGK
ncbi:hypothetical protein [Thermococcus sp. ES12]|uniref:hypothetical protein n=1 Tax=Thermococcus sp. ES12 TaxID=1638246 RepID=UPI0014304F9E|nr:hypothetical protein [Thermococcus sp. ES12]NJE76925.1 hypothetical protein [Thermococcus sp. ES12]